MPLDPDRHWRLNPAALELLLSRLSPDSPAAAAEYDQIRKRLVAFFERRRLVDAATLADQTIDRTARRLQEGEDIRQPRAYLYGIAKRVALEASRRKALEVPPGGAAFDGDEQSARQEARIRCLQDCLGRLPPDSRRLIVGYYKVAGPEGREALARKLEISYAALKTRAHRIRNSLHQCMRNCLDEKDFR
jgi:DNA-directed RNA polymerase specialized sigma24 family protein